MQIDFRFFHPCIDSNVRRTVTVSEDTEMASSLSRRLDAFPARMLHAMQKAAKGSVFPSAPSRHVGVIDRVEKLCRRRRRHVDGPNAAEQIFACLKNDVAQLTTLKAF